MMPRTVQKQNIFVQDLDFFLFFSQPDIMGGGRRLPEIFEKRGSGATTLLF